MHPPSAHRPGRRTLATACVATLALVLGLLGLAAPASARTGAAAGTDAAAGTFQQVTDFGSNPGNLQMYEYAPAGLPSGAPVVVALHGCTQSASDYYNDSGWAKFADQWKFAVVFPQTTTANNIEKCFSWFDSSKDTRGNGEAASILSMVTHTEQQFGSDTHRVYVTGLSAGAGMTADLLADYPDVFAGGSVDSGLPAQCATTLTAASGCQMNDQHLTPAQWGQKAKDSDPGYGGPWPRVAIWQGTADYTVYPVNATELVAQWTDVRGIGQTPSSTRSLPGSTTESLYNDSTGTPAVASFSISGMGHGLAVDPGSGTSQCGATGAYFLDTICSSYYTALFWGLDGPGGGGGGGTGSLPPPANLKATATTDTTATLSWDAVDSAASYTVYRDGSETGTTTSTHYTDTGLTAGTSYTYTVAAVDSSGTAGATSNAATATTTGGFAPRCFTADNYDQVAAGRATTSGGYVYAAGSGQAMGLYNVFVTHTLEETAPGHYIVADTGCPA